MIGQYVVCGQYPGAVPAGATVRLNCSGNNLPQARYVIVQFQGNNYMNFCELDVCANGTFDLLQRVRNKSSAVAEMGDHLATIDTGRKVGAAVPLSVGELGPHLRQFCLGRGLPP